ncbi:alpha/beta fold hydrolase [Sulfitobacter sp. LCG007]
MADVLLVHGACHGGWCWRDTIPALQARGHRPRAIDLPGHGADRTPVAEVTLDAYADAVLAASTPDTVVIGHSMGGYAITAAAQKDPSRFGQLIYLCAYVPVPGKSLAEMRRMAPRQPLLPAVRLAGDGRSFTVDPSLAPGIFYQDCPPEALAYALARLCPQAVAPTAAALDSIDRALTVPRHYIRCRQDGTIPYEFQCEMTADWPESQVEDMDCGHSPFFADPDGLARRIDAAIRS